MTFIAIVERVCRSAIGNKSSEVCKACEARVDYRPFRFSGKSFGMPLRIGKLDGYALPALYRDESMYTKKKCWAFPKNAVE